MTPAEKEAAAVNDAYAKALAIYGASVVAQVLYDWNAVNYAVPSGRTALLLLLMKRIKDARRKLAALSLARARLVSALRSGVQQVGGTQVPRTLKSLRESFTEALGEVGAPRARHAISLNASKFIPIDPETGDLDTLLETINDAIDDEIEGTFGNLGAGRLAKIAKKQGVVTADDIATSRNMVAQGMERIALNGARDTDAKVIQLNKKVYGVVRKHNAVAGDAPCGFCAVLLSRGAVYLSKRSGESTFNEETREWEKYHPGCHCTAEEVYSESEWLNSPRYALNRALQVEWNENIKGRYAPQDAMSEWRKHVKRYFAKQSAQAAA